MIFRKEFRMNTVNDTPRGASRRYLWALVSLLIAAASVWAVTSQARGFSPRHFSEFLDGINPWYLGAAALMSLAYIGFDAWMIGCLLKGFGYRQSHPHCLSYAAADLYFSAITPSGTGGQPMEAYFMVKDGVPGVISTVVLLAYLLLYTLSIVIIGLLCLILVPGSYMAFGTFGRILIAVGALIQLSLALLYALLLWHKRLLLRLCDFALRVGARLHLVRDLGRREDKLYETMDRYSKATEMLKGKRKLLLKALLLNIAHRGSQILVTVLCYVAGGGSLRAACAKGRPRIPRWRCGRPFSSLFS